MLCCGNCFDDRGLSEQIIPFLSRQSGACPTCHSTTADLVEARSLGDYFELLCGIYVEGESDKVLADWLIDDWQLFPIHRDTANVLLMEILDDGERIRQSLVPSERCRSDSLDRWKELRNELRFRNRFFPDSGIKLDRLEQLFAHMMIELSPSETQWWRARVQRRSKAYSLDEMKAPPIAAASHGRVNPAGIPYLYLGSQIRTVISEVRPHPGEVVCIAEFEVPAGTQLVDLRNPRQMVSPFLLQDENEIALMRGEVDFLERLGHELSTPVLPHTAAIDYTPTQYLCEYIKKCGYGGVVFSSSLGDGNNLALFDPMLKPTGTVDQYRVEKVNVSYAKY